MSENKSRGSLDEFDARLARARDKGRQNTGSGRPALGTPASGMGVAFRIGVELVAALIVGVGIGLLLDRWLGTAPWFLILFFFLGAAAGVLNVYRAAKGLGMAVGYRPSDRNSEKRVRDKTDGSA
jgi:ATP synthase protein I